MRIALLLALTSFGSFQPPPPQQPERSLELRGLWLKESADKSEFRFYYFHSNGIGLYRYGRRHLNNTNSYDYRVEGSDLILRFRKTGDEWRVKVRIEREGVRQWLVLENDPREATPTRYRKIEGPLEMAGLESEDHRFARMWTEQRTYATGGIGFRIYQFQAPDGNGRGNGWYHQGDYDDWSTEAFTYGRSGDRLHLFFLEKKEHEVTEIAELEGSPKRAIELMSDPRNFWHRARFLDGGRSIISLGGTAFLGASHAFEPPRSLPPAVAPPLLR